MSRERVKTPITMLEVLNRMEAHYGDAGVIACEGTCLTPADLEQGWDHCLGRCLPALEEELLSDESWAL